MKMIRDAEKDPGPFPNLHLFQGLTGVELEVVRGAALERSIRESYTWLPS